MSNLSISLISMPIRTMKYPSGRSRSGSTSAGLVSGKPKTNDTQDPRSLSPVSSARIRTVVESKPPVIFGTPLIQALLCVHESIQSDVFYRFDEQLFVKEPRYLDESYLKTALSFFETEVDRVLGNLDKCSGYSLTSPQEVAHTLKLFLLMDVCCSDLKDVNLLKRHVEYVCDSTSQSSLSDSLKSDVKFFCSVVSKLFLSK